MTLVFGLRRINRVDRRDVFACALLSAIVAIARPSAAGAQSYRQFGDWIAACDNVGSCTAIGLSAESDSNAFMRVTRTAGARPSFRVEVALATASTGPSLRLRVALDGRRAAHVHIPAFPAKGDGQYARGLLTGTNAATLVASLPTGTTLSVKLTSGSRNTQATVLLDGSARALAAFEPDEARQTPPSVVANRIKLSAGSNRPLPSGVHRSAEPGCSHAPDIWIALSPSGTIRGICTDAGAYNVAYEFYFTDSGPVRTASFRIPWRKPDAGFDGLVNPNIARDGMSINSYMKDVGYGGCGESSDWAWTGARFALIRLSELHACRGVPDEDWPIVFQARVH